MASGANPTIVEFTCAAPASAGSLTIPDTVLLSMPGSNISFVDPGLVPILQVMEASQPQTFTASGLDFATIQSMISYSVGVNYVP